MSSVDSSEAETLNLAMDDQELANECISDIPKRQLSLLGFKTTQSSGKILFADSNMQTYGQETTFCSYGLFECVLDDDGDLFSRPICPLDRSVKTQFNHQQLGIATKLFTNNDYKDSTTFLTSQPVENPPTDSAEQLQRGRPFNK
jgi:hypothetical protein